MAPCKKRENKVYASHLHRSFEGLDGLSGNTWKWIIHALKGIFLTLNTFVQRVKRSCVHRQLLAWWEQQTEKKLYSEAGAVLGLCWGGHWSAEDLQGLPLCWSWVQPTAVHCRWASLVRIKNSVAIKLTKPVTFFKHMHFLSWYLTFLIWQKSGVLFRILQPTWEKWESSPGEMYCSFALTGAGLQAAWW